MLRISQAIRPVLADRQAALRRRLGWRRAALGAGEPDAVPGVRELGVLADPASVEAS